MLKRLNRKIPRIHHTECIQSYNINKLYHHPRHHIVTLIHQQINNDIENYRKSEQFQHIIDQRRDWMSYLILQIRFKKNTTMVTLRSFDRVLFGVKYKYPISIHKTPWK